MNHYPLLNKQVRVVFHDPNLPIIEGKLLTADNWGCSASCSCSSPNSSVNCLNLKNYTFSVKSGELCKFFYGYDVERMEAL